MPISIEWDPQAQIWTLNSGKTFSLTQISDLVEQTDWKGAKLYLWDLRALKKGPGSLGEIRQNVDLVKRTRELWKGSRVAIVVAREIDYGIARMFSSYAGGGDVEYHVFREDQSAFKWLQTPAVV